MDEHTARVFVGDTIFGITMTTLAPHLWQSVPLSDVGIAPESVGKLARALGLDPANVNLDMTLEALVKKVAAESPLEVRIETKTFLKCFWIKPSPASCSLKSSRDRRVFS